jgi:hypothetical protein
MITSLKKAGGAQAAGNKFSIYFLKEKENTALGYSSHYFILIELIFSTKDQDSNKQPTSKDGHLPLEAVKISILTKDPQAALEKTVENTDEDIASVSKSLDAYVDKYSEMMMLYNLNIESVKNYLDLCVARKVRTINFKIKVPYQVFEQRLKKSDNSKNNDWDKIGEIPEFQKYLSELLSSKEKKKMMEKKNLRIDLLSLCHAVYSYKLDFVFESTIKQDFLMAYEATLSEFCDYSFKIKAYMSHEKTTHYHSKFIKEHLLAIMYIE